MALLWAVWRKAGELEGAKGKLGLNLLRFKLEEQGDIGGQLVEEILHILSYGKERMVQDQGVSG